MEPIKVEMLPIKYNIDKELLNLISEANEKYGEYKSNLKNSQFDSKFFLDSIILSESLKSTQIEGTQISQDEMYYLKYMPKTDDNLEIQNLKKVIEYAKDHLKQGKIDIKFVNSIHRILLDSVRGNEKEPGKIRNVQNWVGPKGCTIEEAIFVPPIPEEVPILLDNLFQICNLILVKGSHIEMKEKYQNENFNIPYYLFEEIIEYIEETAKGKCKSMKWKNIKKLIRLAVINNRLTKNQGEYLIDNICREHK